jgi:hypothetical protein
MAPARQVARELTGALDQLRRVLAAAIATADSVNHIQSQNPPLISDR